jgi:hypothetical protein
MFFIFGTRKSKLKSTRLSGDTECPNCQQKNTMVSATYGNYIHIFWIPLIPFSKFTVVACEHCRTLYDEQEFNSEMKSEIEATNEVDPPKRPIWHGCGCLLIVAMFAIGGCTAFVGWLKSDDAETTEEEFEDPRQAMLAGDLELVTNNPDPYQDSLAFFLKNCMASSIDGIDVHRIEYYTKINGYRLLILTKVSDFKGVSRSSRKEFVHALDDCLDLYELSGYETYIAVDGRWNMLMIKTPHGSELGGSFANEKLLYPFYNEIDTTTNKQDQILEMDEVIIEAD